MKTTRMFASALAIAGVLAATACSAEPAPVPDEGIDVVRATGECRLLAGFLTADYELNPDNVEEMVEILAGVSESGYPESTRVAEMIIASYSEEPPTQEEADAVVKDWAGFCDRNSTS
ncbi:hypothetical protein [Arthrobacter sp. zg-Y1110]|uniref:hypothetical protein n=1 Tax=Arthrobacter sp. zg-Y1110 TaxID=2886932 RepID=UPI001D143F2F|nr:hypothetical protein [Arthrobacter sp. zg-Y1110]MCC3292376.1 hypothetical protein [Arthrobacter sp. zg-Y1110]UWX86721.1 hypothetical protein N2K99_17925 [Arthrobacter sp. zg-Y1110]